MNCGRYSGIWVFDYWSLHIHNHLLQFAIRILTKKVLAQVIIPVSMLVFVNLGQARIRATREHDFGLSLSSFDSTKVPVV